MGPTNALLSKVNIGWTYVLRGQESGMWYPVNLVMSTRASGVTMAPQLFSIFVNNLSDEIRILSKSIEDIKFGSHNK